MNTIDKDRNKLQSEDSRAIIFDLNKACSFEREVDKTYWEEKTTDGKIVVMLRNFKALVERMQKKGESIDCYCEEQNWTINAYPCSGLDPANDSSDGYALEASFTSPDGTTYKVIYSEYVDWPDWNSVRLFKNGKELDYCDPFIERSFA